MKMDNSGFGSCAMRSPDGIAIPLTGVSVEGTLHGGLLAVRMSQRWTNTSEKPLETLWHVPLPEHAVVHELAIERGEVCHKAVVLSREEAFNRYEDATEEGWRTALLDAETEGVLSFRLGNLDAGDSILVTLSWVAMVEASAGSLRIRIPTAIAPRYFPSLPDEEAQVPLQDRLALPWIDRVPYGITVKMVLDDPESIQQVTSPSHPLSLEFSDHHVTVQLGADDAPMDRDFVLDVALRKEQHPHAWCAGAHGDCWIAVEARLPDAPARAPKSIAFLLDTSGSMMGESLAAAKNALTACIGALATTDRFGVFAFNSVVHDGQKQARTADAQSLRKARAWIERQEATGGTELLSALEHIWSWGGWTDVLVITDGETGDTERIAAMASRQHAAGTRLHILGIGSAPAVDAIAQMVCAGGGTYGMIHPNDRIEPRTLALFGTILAGAAEHVSLMVDGNPCELPAEVSGCAGRQLRLLARLPGASKAPASVMLKATIAGEPWHCEVPIHQPDAAPDAGTIACLWAREKVSALLDAAGMADDPHEKRRLEQEASDLAVRHGILTPVSSMVLIDDEGEKVGGSATFMDVPVALPHGWGGHSVVRKLLCMPSTAASQDMNQMVFREDIVPLALPAIQPSDQGIAPWWDLLALQIPGGGFGPVKDFLAVLGLVDKHGQLVSRWAGEPILCALREGTLAADQERILMAALGIAWLESKWGKESYAWEPLVRESRVLAGKPVDRVQSGGMTALEWARRIVP